MHQNETTSEQQNQQLVNNALTMQKALETAYNDWNKDKNVQNHSEITNTPETQKSEPIKQTKKEVKSAESSSKKKG